MKRMIQAALFSHEDKSTFTAEEVLEKALSCQREGASLVHVHMYKLGSDEEFFRFAKMVEEHDGPALNLSVSDYAKFFQKDRGVYKIIKSVAVHASDCIVFGNFMPQSYEELVEDVKICLEKGIFPEVSIFNKMGAEYCVRLNQIYPDKFYVGIYLNYPLELEGTKENILEIFEILKDIKGKVFALYNNSDNDIVKFILQNGGDIRVGAEDMKYCGGKESDDTIAMVKNVANIVRECGFEVETQFGKRK